MRWADVELVVISHLKTVTTKRVVSKLPGQIEQILPVIRVTRGPGSDDKITDFPLVDVEVFAGNLDTAWGVAEDVREGMHALSGRAVAGKLIDTVTTAMAPNRMDYENPAVERIVASYRLAQRKSTT